jgi:hypothetical protein
MPSLLLHQNGHISCYCLAIYSYFFFTYVCICLWALWVSFAMFFLLYQRLWFFFFIKGFAGMLSFIHCPFIFAFLVFWVLYGFACFFFYFFFYVVGIHFVIHVFLFFLAWFSLVFAHLRDIIQVQMCTAGFLYILVMFDSTY